MAHTLLPFNAEAQARPPTRPPLNRRQALGAATLACLWPLAPTARAQAAASLHGDFVGVPGTRVRFATAAQARELLMADDDWMKATSAFQRRAVVRSAGPVSLDVFKAWNGDAARDWPAAQVARWHQAWQALAPAVAALRIPLPAEVWMVHSNGQESAAAPYTRGHFITLPGLAAVAGYGDTLLLMHELWHVASRHSPALATRLYAELGFEPMAPLQMPDAWADISIANPDAPVNRHAMRLTLPDGQPGPWITPVLVAGRTQLQANETFFSVLDVRLLEVLPASPGTAGPSTARLRAGQPVWHAVNGAHGYLRRLGGNTGYVMHPEEALADNIALLVTGARARNPALLERLRAVLLQPGS